MNQLSRQEWDALSAYLDNALNNRERQRLEAQLQSRPEVRAALNELRQTRQLLRQTPTLRVPRNFTLTPEMAGLRYRRPRTYPFFKLAFALASIFFGIVIAGEQILGSPAALLDSNLAMAPQAEMVEEAPAEEPVAMEAMQEEAVEEAAGAEPEDARLAETPSTETEMEEAALAPDEGTAQPANQESFQVAEAPTVTPETVAEPSLEMKMAEETPLEEPIPQEETSVDAPAFEEESETQVPSAETPFGPGWWAKLLGNYSPWRLLQVIFGVAVAISGLGLFLMRRRS